MTTILWMITATAHMLPALLPPMAPGAKLKAYKVLDSNGWGDGSWIIGAIELSVMDDVDIINLSLGGQGHADDPMSLAIDNANAAGMICVVAAGNNGPNYKTIDSPGASRSAITVGASDDHNSLASFSSRGPSNVIYGMKPDMLAPGVSITSPIPQNGYASWDGTSMATPHIAGVAALMLEWQPDLTPTTLKSRLMQSAMDLGYNPFEQGAGRVRPVKALEDPQLIVAPASLGFGAVDISQNIWTSTKTFNIINTSGESKNINLTLDGQLPNGAEVIIIPDDANLLPNESMAITVTLTIDNLTLPYMQPETPAYFESINVVTQGFSYSLPFSFAKKPHLRLIFDEAPFFFNVFCRSGAFYFNSYYWPGNDVTIDLPGNGTYDIFVNFTDYKSFAIIEAHEVNGFSTIQIDRAISKNHIQLLTIDNAGDTITPTTGMDHIFTWREDNMGAWGTLGIFFDQEYFFVERNFSDFSLYQWQWNGFYMSDEDGKNYVFGGSLDVCNEDVSYHFEPQDFLEYDFNYHNLNDADEIVVMPSLLEFIFMQDDPNIYPLSHPFKQNYLISPHFGGASGQGFIKRIFKYDGPDFEMNEENLIYSSPTYLFSESRGLDLASSYYDIGANDIKTDLVPFSSKTINMGADPINWNGLLWKSQDNVVIPQIFRSFNWHLGESIKLNSILYRIKQQNQTIASGNLFDDYYVYGNYDGHISLGLPQGNCTLELDSPLYTISGRSGKGTMRARFNSSFTQSTSYYPGIKNLYVTSGNIPTNILQTGNDNQVHFGLKTNSSTSGNPPITPNLYFKHESHTNWNNAALIQQAGDFQTTIPDFFAEGYYDLKLELINQSDTLEYELKPAFYKIGQQFADPEIFVVGGGGSYCQEMDPTYAHITLTGSEMYLTYQLFKNNQPIGQLVVGNGLPLIWPNLSAGTYQIKAFNGQQWFDMDSSAVIVEHALPEINCNNISVDSLNVEDESILLFGATPEGGYFSGPGVNENNFFSPSTAGIGNHLLEYTYTDTLSGCSNSCQFSVMVISIVEVYRDERAVIKLYPNPAKTNLQIQFAILDTGIVNTTYSLNDLRGSLKLYGKLSQGENCINVSSLKNGLYLLEVFTDEERLTTLKVLVHK